jgi:ankyrin repeat protein
MLRVGMNVNLRSSNRAQSTALLEAVNNKHTSVVQLLLKNGALPDMSDARSRRPLVVATNGRSDVAITKLLLEHGATADSVVFDKNAPLMEAVRSNQESKVVWLLKHGANTHILDRRTGMTLVHIAASKNATPGIINILIGSGIQVESQDDMGRTPLQVAAVHSCTRAVRLLLNLGANPNFKNNHQYWKGWSALFYAAANPSIPGDGRKSIIRTLLLHGAEINARNHAQKTPLLHAISQSATKQAQALVECGASIMATDANGETVIHLAASSSSWCPSMMGWLVENGADVNWIGGKHSETPIFYAIRNFYNRNGMECVQNLLLLGADVHFRNIDGLTPLSLAVHMGSIESTKILLEHGSYANSRDNNGKSPLHYAAEAWNAHKIVQLLIQYGADVNSRDMLGFTPLHRIVTREESWEAAGELLKAGADRYAIANNGKFPHDMVPDGPWAETKRSLIRFYMS